MAVFLGAGLKIKRLPLTIYDIHTINGMQTFAVDSNLCNCVSAVLLCVDLDEFNDFCDRLEKTSEWGGQAEVLDFVTLSPAVSK